MGKRLRAGITVLALAVLSVPSRVVFSQPPPVPSGLPGPAPAPALPARGLNAGPLAVPPPPTIEDPMLAAVPAPPRVIRSWDEAERLLLGRSSNLRMAVDQVLVAEGQTMVALAQVLPSFGGCAGGSSAPPGCGNSIFTHQLLTRPYTETIAGEPVSGVLPVPNTLTASATLSQDILNLQEFDQVGISKLTEQANHLTVKDTRRTLALSLATQIVSVVTAERTAEINRGGLRVALEQLELTKRKAALGAAMLLDIVRADQNATNARVALVSGDEALRQARESLGLILGLSEETGVSPDINVNGLAQDVLRECTAIDDVAARPDVAAARKNLEVAKRNLRNTWYSFVPVITGQSTLAATTAVNLGYPNPTWTIGAALSVPLFDGGSRLGTIKSQRAQEDVAEQTLYNLLRQDIIQVEQAQRGVEVAENSYRVSLRQRDLAAQNDSLTQALWARGQGTSVDLVTASEAHRLAEQSLVVAEFNVVKARLAVVMALATCPG
jgi:outer membrane protein, multidrug efflux system